MFSCSDCQDIRISVNGVSTRKGSIIFDLFPHHIAGLVLVVIMVEIFEVVGSSEGESAVLDLEYPMLFISLTPLRTEILVACVFTLQHKIL